MFSKLFVILHYKTNNVNETADGYSLDSALHKLP
jgi:hypothetical protein